MSLFDDEPSVGPESRYADRGSTGIARDRVTHSVEDGWFWLRLLSPARRGRQIDKTTSIRVSNSERHPGAVHHRDHLDRWRTDVHGVVAWSEATFGRRLDPLPHSDGEGLLVLPHVDVLKCSVGSLHR